MKQIFLILLLFPFIVKSQSYNPVSQPTDFKKDIKLSNFNNNTAEDSVLTIDHITHKLKQVLKSGGIGTDPTKRFISDTAAQTGTSTNFSTRKYIDSITNNFDKTKQLLWHKGTLVDSVLKGQITFDGNFIASHDTVFSAYRAGVNFTITDSVGADGRTYKVMRSTGGSGGGGSVGGRFSTNQYGILIDSATANLYKIKTDTTTILSKLNANAAYGTHFGFSADSLTLYLIAANGTKLDSSKFTGATAGGGTTLNGTGFVKALGTTISYDNSTYQTANSPITVTATGDATGTSTSSSTTPSLPITLATVNSNIGTFNNITINGKGLATAGSNVTYQAPISLTTTGTSGVATFGSNILNIPQYAGTTYTGTSPISVTGSVISLTTVPVANGGTGTTTPGLVAGTNITSITGAWPNQTINAVGSVGGGLADTTLFWPLTGKYVAGYGKFLGTRDLYRLNFKTNDSIRISVDSIGGNVGVGVQADPNFKLKVGNLNGIGSVYIQGDSPSGVALWLNDATAIRGNATSGGTMYIDGDRSTGGTINMRSTNLNVSGTTTFSSTVAGTIFNSSVAGGYKISGLDIFNLKIDSTIFRFNDNSIVRNIGYRAANNLMYSSNSSPTTWTFTPSAILELRSTTTGFLMPQMTQTQRDAIASPATLLRVSNTTTNSNDTYDGVSWKRDATWGYISTAGTYTALSTDYTINCTSGTFVVTLPTAIGIQGRVYIVKNSGAGIITMAGNTAQTFDGVTSPTIAAGAVAQYQSNNANWIKIN